MEILVLCTGNICRSPVAEALLRDRLAQRGVAARVSSAGVATEDRPPTDEVIELLAKEGIDISGHRSRLVTATMVGGADLVVGMAREHVREATLLEPSAFGRSFTLRELVRGGAEVGPRPDDLDLRSWVDLVGEGRTPAAYLGLSDADDIDDPMGRRFGVYKRVTAQIVELVDELVALAWPSFG